jgi:amidase
MKTKVKTPSPEFEELSIWELSALLDSGEETSRSLAERYVARIYALNPVLHAILEINPEAVHLATELDRERERNGPRSAMHGIPVLVKDNIDTADRMTTTAGSLALQGTYRHADAPVVQRLRASGALILGKTNMSEWANFRSSHSSSGWSARGGQCRNPYVLDRSPSGSSSGSAVAVASGLCGAAVGTETDGSIISPSHTCSIVGLKPTVGAIPSEGIIPIAHSQDTAGPMGRTVKDVALLFSAMSKGTGRRSAVAKRRSGAISHPEDLNAESLKRRRLGVMRGSIGGRNQRVDEIFEEALQNLRRLGAELIDPVEIPGSHQYRENEVLLYEFKHDLNRYLSGLGPSAPIRTLDDLVSFNETHSETEMPFFGQDVLTTAAAKGPLTERAYLRARAQARRMSRRLGIDLAVRTHNLDALVAPSGTPAWLIDLVNGDPDIQGNWSVSAIAGYPHVTVPAGYVRGLPVGLSFFGRAWTDWDLLAYAYAYEQATQHRMGPTYLPSVSLE